MKSMPQYCSKPHKVQDIQVKNKERSINNRWLFDVNTSNCTTCTICFRSLASQTLSIVWYFKSHKVNKQSKTNPILWGQNLSSGLNNRLDLLSWASNIHTYATMSDKIIINYCPRGYVSDYRKHTEANN
jgi:hypothetical protein